MPRCALCRRISSIALVAGSVVGLQGEVAIATPCEPVIESLGTGASGPVYALTTARNSDDLLELFIGGAFETVDGLTVNNLGVWNGTE